MPFTYRNQSLVMPFRLWVIPDTELFRIELPCVERTTPTEWLFNDKVEKMGIWKPYNGTDPVLYGLSVASFPPTCKGTDLYQFVQNDQHPYNTEFIVLGAYLEGREVTSRGFFKDRQVHQLYLFSYPVPNTKLLYVWAHLDMYNVLSYRLLVDPDITDYKTEDRTRGKYIHNSIYALTTSGGYWRQTTESLCVPIHEYDPNDRTHFMTLAECQSKTYPTIQNRHTWIGTNSQPLYQYMKWWHRQPKDRQIQSVIYKQM